MIARRALLAAIPAAGVAMALPASNAVANDPQRDEFIAALDRMSGDQLEKLQEGVRAMKATLLPAADRILYHQAELRRLLEEDRGGDWLVCVVDQSESELGAQWFGLKDRPEEPVPC